MSSVHQDLTVYQGDAATLTFTVKDADGVVVDITGATIRWQMARDPGDATALLSKSTIASPGGILITDGDAGVFTVTITAGDTSLFEGAYYHEARVDDAVVIVGTINVNLRLT